MSVELPEGFKILSTSPIDERMKVPTLASILNNPTFYMGYSPIYDEETGKTYQVSGGNFTDGWEFSQFDGITGATVGATDGVLFADYDEEGKNSAQLVQSEEVSEGVYDRPKIKLSSGPYNIPSLEVGGAVIAAATVDVSEDSGWEFSSEHTGNIKGVTFSTAVTPLTQMTIAIFNATTGESRTTTQYSNPTPTAGELIPLNFSMGGGVDVTMGDVVYVGFGIPEGVQNSVEPCIDHPSKPYVSINIDVVGDQVAEVAFLTDINEVDGITGAKLYADQGVLMAEYSDGDEKDSQLIQAQKFGMAEFSRPHYISKYGGGTQGYDINGPLLATYFEFTDSIFGATFPYDGEVESITVRSSLFASSNLTLDLRLEGVSIGATTPITIGAGSDNQSITCTFATPPTVDSGLVYSFRVSADASTALKSADTGGEIHLPYMDASINLGDEQTETMATTSDLAQLAAIIQEVIQPKPYCIAQATSSPTTTYNVNGWRTITDLELSTKDGSNLTRGVSLSSGTFTLDKSGIYDATAFIRVKLASVVDTTDTLVRCMIASTVDSGYRIMTPYIETEGSSNALGPIATGKAYFPAGGVVVQVYVSADSGTYQIDSSYNTMVSMSYIGPE